MTPSPSAPFEGVLRLPGGVVVLAHPQSVLDVLRALQKLTAECRSNGTSAPARVFALIGVFDAALADHTATSATTSAEVPPPPVLRQSTKWVGVDQAARVLGISTRQVRNLAEDHLGGVKVGRSWRFDPLELEEFARYRAERSAAA